MEASHSARHRGGKSGYEVSQKDNAADGPKSKSDLSAAFLRAARSGNYEKVAELLKENRVDIDACNVNGLNALHLAAKDGHVNIVVELLNHGVNVDSATKKGNTGLHIASLAGQLDVVKTLIQYQARINIQSQAGFTPLYMAAQENHAQVVKYLLDKGANASLATEEGFTPLAVALQQEHSEVVAILTEASQRGRVKLSALHVAAKKDDVRGAVMLLENEQNQGDRSRASELINEPTKSGFTPLHIAAHYGNQNVATVLIDHGADVDFKARNSITPLHVASKWGRKNIASLLLNNYATVDCKTRDGLTPLHCAARSGHDLVVNLLLDSNAPVSAKTRNGLSALHMAAQGDHVDCARILISHKAAVDEVTVDYLTPLHVAAHCGNVTTAKLLLDRNCEVNSRALNGFTPLHIACKKNRVKVIELLLQYGANIGSTTESGLTPLHVASFMGYIEIVQMLLGRGCDPNAPTVRGETPLHLATRGSQVEVMRLLLKSGAAVDAKAKEDQTPLHTAARTGSTDAVILLLQHKADPNAGTKELYTPLHIAAKEGHDDVIQVLLERGADPTRATSKGFSPLHIAAKYGNLDAAKTLMSNGGDVNCIGKNGLTPLHVATHYNQIEMVQLLLDKGANPHAVAKNGYTPLHIAAKKNEMEIATSLLEHRAKPNADSRNGFTPLHLAAQEGHMDMVALLLRAGAKSNCKAKNGLTPMHLAAQEDHVPVAEVLVRHESEIDTQTKAGYTPLHTACHFGQLNMIRFLLENGASVQMTTKAGHTPLHQAAQQGHVLVINMLLRCRADPNALTANGQTPLSIAQCLGYISVVEILKEKTTVTVTEFDEKLKYRLMSPEIMQEAAMSDEEDDDEEDEKHLADQSYQYLTTGDDIGGLREEPGGDVGVQGKDQDPFAFDQRSSLHSSQGFGPTQEDMRYTTDDLDSQSGGSLRRHRPDERAWIQGESREPRLGGPRPPSFKSTEDQVYYLENGARPGDVGDFDAASAPLRKRSKMKATTHVEETILTRRILRGEPGFTETHFDDEPEVPVARRETSLGAEAPYSVLVLPKDQYDIRDVAREGAADSDEAQWRSAGSARLTGGRDMVLPPRDQYDVTDFMKRDSSDVEEAGWHDSGRGEREVGRGVVVLPRDQYDAREMTERDAVAAEEESRMDAAPTKDAGMEVVIREHLVPDVDDEKMDTEILTPPVEEAVKEAEAHRYDTLAAPDFTRGFRSNLSETDSRMFGSTYSGMSFASSLDPDNVALNRQPIYSGFLVSFLVDARGGAMRGCRHSGIRIIIPPGRACMPTRVTCKLVKREKLPQPPPLMEGEALASRVLVMGPSGAKFLGPVILEVPHFASLRGAEREITVLRSENGQTWREHTDLATLDSIQNTLCGSFEGEDLESAEELYHRRITRIITSDFPKYFAIVTRIRQETSVVSQKGGIISSTVVPQVQTVFPPGAVTKSIKLGLQAHPITDELVEKVCGNKVSVSPIVTIEPRRRKFHQPITVTIPLPPNLQSVKQVEKIPTLRLLCSMNAAMDPTEWEDITGSTPMTLTNNCVSFTTTVSARFWLVNCENPKECLMSGNNLYAEAIVVPFMANFVVFAKRLGLLDAQLRLFCMTDDKMDKTLESQEKFAEVSRSRDVEVLDGKPQWVECTGNLLRVLKGEESDKQPKISFRAFRENRQSLNVRVRHFEDEPTGSLLFMRDPRTTKEQAPICNLTVTLPSSDGTVSTGSTVDTDELQQKLQMLKQLELPEEELISKAELRLTDIAEYLTDDWVPLAKQLRLTPEDINRIEKEYTYVVEQALVMLHTWIEREKDGASGNALERALRSIGRLDIIAKCIYAVEEVTDIKEKQAAKVYLDSGDPDGMNGELDLDQQNGYHDELIDTAKHEPIKTVSQTVTSTAPKIRRVIKVGEKEVPEDILSYVREQALSALASCRAQDPTRRDPPLPSAGIIDEGPVPDGVRKDYLVLSVETKTPPSTPADLDNLVASPTVTESEVAASMAKKTKRTMHDEDDDDDVIEPEIIGPEVQQEPTTVAVQKPTDVTVQEPTTVTVQKPTTAKVLEPATVTVHEPATVTVHEPATVSVPEPTTVTVPEPTIATVQKPTTATVQKPATVTVPEPTTATVQEPATVTVQKPTTVTVQDPANQVPSPTTNGAIDASVPKPILDDTTSFEDWVERKQMSYSDPSRRERLTHENSKEVVACEVRKQTIDGDLDLKIEIDEDETMSDDGTLIRRQVITRRHVYPVTEITTIDGVEADWKTTEKLVKVEVEEDVLELPPGVDDSADQENLATRTSVEESDEVTEDGVPLHRKVTRTVIVPFVPEIESRAERMVVDAFDEAFDEVKAAAAAERADPRDTSDHGSDSADSAVLRVYTDMQEGIPEVETDVQEFEETLPDGSIIKRRVIKTKQKQTITKRVVVEGPEDELPANEEEAQEMMRRVEADEPAATRIENRNRDAPDTGTSVQEYEETLADGTVVKRRIVTTTEQQLTTERVVLEGDDFEDEEYEDGTDDHIPYSERTGDDSGMQIIQAEEDADGEETATVMMKKEIRKKKILRDGKEETIITEDVHMVQDEEEPEELRDSVQMIIDQFMEGTSLDTDSSYGQHK